MPSLPVAARPALADPYPGADLGEAARRAWAGHPLCDCVSSDLWGTPALASLAPPLWWQATNPLMACNQRAPPYGWCTWLAHDPGRHLWTFKASTCVKYMRPSKRMAWSATHNCFPSAFNVGNSSFASWSTQAPCLLYCAPQRSRPCPPRSQHSRPRFVGSGKTHPAPASITHISSSLLSLDA